MQFLAIIYIIYLYVLYRKDSVQKTVRFVFKELEYNSITMFILEDVLKRHTYLWGVYCRHISYFDSLAV